MRKGGSDDGIAVDVATMGHRDLVSSVQCLFLLGDAGFQVGDCRRKRLVLEVRKLHPVGEPFGMRGADPGPPFQFSNAHHSRPV